MANNHGADYGLGGLHGRSPQSPRQIPGDRRSALNAAGVRTVWRTVNGVRLAVFAATPGPRRDARELLRRSPRSRCRDDAFSPLLVNAVRAAQAAGYIVVVYLHWGTEYQTCPNEDQTAPGRKNSPRRALQPSSAPTPTCSSVRDGGRTGATSPTACRTICGGSRLATNRTTTECSPDLPGWPRDCLPLRAGALGRHRRAGSATGAVAARISAEWQRDRQCADLLTHAPVR